MSFGSLLIGGSCITLCNVASNLKLFSSTAAAEVVVKQKHFSLYCVFKVNNFMDMMDEPLQKLGWTVSNCPSTYYQKALNQKRYPFPPPFVAPLELIYISDLRCGWRRRSGGGVDCDWISIFSELIE